MDMKNSLIISCVIIFGIIGILSGYSIYQNNVKMHKNFIAAQDAFRNSQLNQAEKLLEGNPPHDIEKDFYLLKYNVQMNLNKLAQAEETCLKLLKLAPKDDFINYLTGLVYSNLGDREKAELYFKNAIKYSPGNVNYKMKLANLYANIGKDDEAIKLFEELKTLMPDYEVAYASLAGIYEAKGDMDKALKYRKEAAEKFSDNSYDLYMLADLYDRLGKKELAAEYFAKTADVDIYGYTNARSKYFEITGKPYHSKPYFQSETIPFESEKGLMFVKAAVNGVQGKFLIDTGATNSILYLSFVKKKKIPVKTSLFGVYRTADGSNSVAPVAIMNFKLGKFKYTDIMTFVVPADNKTFDGIIGNDILEKIDFYADRERDVLTMRSKH